jgi:Prokaryotic dksA/traR C4-type zinc finger
METEPGTETNAEAGTGETGIGSAPDEVLLDAAPEGTADVDTVEALLDQVDRALARLDDGSYGRCETCGTIIADARLAEIPTAHTCAGCPEPAVG